jgi:SNF2 family DNA or RNA helicase
LIYVNARREEKYNVIITTYSKLVGLAKNKNVYGTIHFKGVFLDEGHWIKNSSGKWYEACTSLKRLISFIITGIYLGSLIFLFYV